MTRLSLAEFEPFVREMTGWAPFPWQTRLAQTVLGDGWPDMLDLPTGTGKTTTLLVALFALAVDPTRFHRRIALVVDRRIIVDQVEAYARKLADGLRGGDLPTCRRVAEALLACMADPDPEHPVRVVHLRGGIPRDDAWIGAPDQPTLIASTVDQVGSRLLFRGYGVSEGMRPVHAGVLARDTLYLLDEVHLATAFEETLATLDATYGGTAWVERGGTTGRRFTVVRMSATPRAGAAPQQIFGLGDDDRSHPVLARRLQVSRSARLDEVKTTRSKRSGAGEGEAANRALVAAHVVTRVQEALAGGSRVIGVVLNRVDTARRVARLLDARNDCVCHLVTGRMRGYERAIRQQQLHAVAGAGVPRDPEARPHVVVATSCIEAGADLDFDALVTEAASFDALRQRFGRLNRLGSYEHTFAWIVGRKDQMGESADDDPVYGASLRQTWAYLQSIAQKGVVDFGLQALPVPSADVLRPLLPRVAEAPVMFPAYLDAWSETRPAPHPDPDPALWLHGKDARGEDDVQVVFRAALPDAPSDDSEAASELTEDLGTWLEALPPLDDEAVSVARSEVLKWLGETHVWRWRASSVESVPSKSLTTGDTILVSSARGGLFHGTWDPTSTEPVEDVAERVLWASKQVARLRLHADVLPKSAPKPPDWSRDQDQEEEDEAIRGLVARLLAEQSLYADTWLPLLEALGGDGDALDIVLLPDLSHPERHVPLVVRDRRIVEPTTEDEISSFTGVEVSLEQHLRDVEAWAAALARTAGLDPATAEDVALAGLLHDLGKADPRFQALLRGGDPIAATGAPIAKSRASSAPAARRRAELRSGWPTGYRHELVSLALLDACPELSRRAHDLDLVRHLVASHHGWCRPWAPALLDPEPTSVRTTIAGVTLEVSTAVMNESFLLSAPSRFRRLCRRYGWHGLAYLEALLRLSDHRASRKPGERPKEPPA